MRLPLSDLVTRCRGVIRRRPARRHAIAAATAAVALTVGMTVTAATGQSASATGRPAYMNPHLSVSARVADLLGRMTLPEKIGQMVQIEATQVTDNSNSCTSTGGFNMPNPAREQKIFVDNNVGSINAGLDWANEDHAKESGAVALSRLQVPVVVGGDAGHGCGDLWQAAQD